MAPRPTHNQGVLPVRMKGTFEAAFPSSRIGHIRLSLFESLQAKI